MAQDENSGVSEDATPAGPGIWIVEEEHRDDDGQDGARTFYGYFTTAEDAEDWMNAQPDDENTTEMAALHANLVNVPPSYIIVADTNYYGLFEEDIAATGPFATVEEARRVLLAMYPPEAEVVATVVCLGAVPSAEDLAE